MRAIINIEKKLEKFLKTGDLWEREVQKQMKLLLQRVKHIKETKGVNAEEATKIIKDKIEQDLEQYEKLCEDTIILQRQDTIIKYLRHNPVLVRKTYIELINEGLQPLINYIYNSNKEDLARRIIREIIEILDSQKKYDPNLDIDTQVQIIMGIIQKLTVEKNLKKAYIDLLVNSGEFLIENGCVEKYIESNNENAIADELTIESEQNRKAVYNMFNKEYLETLDINELVFLNVFYQNRMTKERRNVSSAVYYLDQLQLWNRKPKDIYNIDIKTLRKLIGKKYILDNITNEVEIESEYNIKTDDVVNLYQDDYNTIFSEKINECTTDLSSEIATNVKSKYNSKLNYTMKAHLLANMFENLNHSKNINWGYIKQNPDEEKHTILLGIDYPGYVPIYVHIPKDVLRYILNMQGQYLINTYIGSEHRKAIKNDKVKVQPTNILYKFPEEKKKEIVEICKGKKKGDEASTNDNYLHHINSSLKGILPYNTKEKRRKIGIDMLLNNGKDSVEHTEL